MRNPNIDTTTPTPEKEVTNPRRDRELERPEGPGETGPEMIPPGRVRTGKPGGDTDAGKGDDDAGKGDIDDAELDDGDGGEIPASDQDTGRYEQPAKRPTSGDADRGTRTPTRGGDNTARGNRNPRQ